MGTMMPLCPPGGHCVPRGHCSLSGDCPPSGPFSPSGPFQPFLRHFAQFRLFSVDPKTRYGQTHPFKKRNPNNVRPRRIVKTLPPKSEPFKSQPWCSSSSTGPWRLMQESAWKWSANCQQSPTSLWGREVFLLLL